jgi:hypothetical protein
MKKKLVSAVYRGKSIGFDPEAVPYTNDREKIDISPGTEIHIYEGGTFPVLKPGEVLKSIIHVRQAKRRPAASPASAPGPGVSGSQPPVVAFFNSASELEGLKNDPRFSFFAHQPGAHNTLNSVLQKANVNGEFSFKVEYNTGLLAGGNHTFAQGVTIVDGHLKVTPDRLRTAFTPSQDQDVERTNKIIRDGFFKLIRDNAAELPDTLRIALDMHYNIAALLTERDKREDQRFDEIRALISRLLPKSDPSTGSADVDMA